MFTCPVSGGGFIQVGRPSVSAGTITNAANAYDLPASRPDDPPYTTSADRATVTGSSVAGIVDYDVVEYNTFPSRSKSNFVTCQLVVGYSSLLTAVALTNGTLGGGRYINTYVTPSLWIDYQIDGATWINLKTETVNDLGVNFGAAANSIELEIGRRVNPGDPTPTTVTKNTVSIDIKSSYFSSNLNNLKVRFRLGTCKNNVVTTYQSYGSYNVWDIRANLS